MTDPASPHDAHVPDIIRRIDALMGAKTPAAWRQIAPLLLMDVRVVILSESLARQQAERQLKELESRGAAGVPPESGPAGSTASGNELTSAQLIEDVLHDYVDERTKAACDECEQCGPLTMCRFHSLLSLLERRTWTSAAVARAQAWRHAAKVGEAPAQPVESPAPSGEPDPDPVASTELWRYDLVTNYRCGSSIEEMERSDDGEWVRFDEVEHAVNNHESQLLEAQLTVLRQSFDQIVGYAKHSRTCPCFVGWDGPCTCGLSAILSSIPDNKDKAKT